MVRPTSLTWCLRAANSSSPDTPSRRSSSASTSDGARPKRAKRDHRVEPEVGHLGDDLAAIAVLARHHHLGRLFADLLQHRVVALAQQPGHVADRRIAGPPRLDHRRQPRQRVVASTSFVDPPGIFQDRLDDLPAAVPQNLEEARMTAGVAGDRVRPGSLPSCSTFSSTTSLSQSRRTSCTCWTWPLSSPLRHRRWRERLQ